ncbi:hypothetical protein CK505_12555 [Kocuria sp. WN036]|uniref:hypothetical protein n=1 Tax=Kocuria sp. WN036 TaxID=2032628 RepID=UPI000BD5E3B9|nr:hypothetical protein [Kocuria sp. WN036]PAU90104.1 hypothetical protein CK505_12555 [Kocuria sp. WN036]
MNTIEKNGSAEVVRTPEVGLTRKDLADLDLIRRSPERLRELGTEEGSASDKILVHAVFEEGMRAIKDRNMADAYAEMAEEQFTDEGQAERSAHKARRARRNLDPWED